MSEFLKKTDIFECQDDTARAVTDQITITQAVDLDDIETKADAAETHSTETTNPHIVTKAQVGLASVDDTSDANKPVSTAQQTAFDLKANLALVSNIDNTADANKPVSTAQQTALNLKANLASPTFTGTVSGVTKSMVGLGSVDNTADADKPVSTAQQAAIDAVSTSAGTTWNKYTVAKDITSFPFLEHIKITADSAFTVMIQKQTGGGTGTLLTNYGTTIEDVDSQVEIQNLFADALDEVLSGNQSGDSITGNTDIIVGEVISSQVDTFNGNVDTVHIYIAGATDRCAILNDFTIVVDSTDNVVTEANYSDLATIGGAEIFSAVAMTANGTVTVGATATVTEDTVKTIAIKYAIALG